MSESAIPFVKIDGVWVSTDSERGKEYARWNKPYKYEPFPRMVYKAQRRPDGVPSVGEWDDGFFGGQAGAADNFSARCNRTAQSEDEWLKLLGQGWAKSPQEALERFEANEKSIADAAANRAYHEQFMGDSAKREAAAADADSGEFHLPEVPEAPLVKKARAKRSDAGKPRGPKAA